MKLEKVTISQIAKALNISSSTVSRALNNHPKISYKTKEKVFASAEKLGYKTNVVKLNMVSKNNFIALILPEIESDFSLSFIKHFQNSAQSENYKVTIFNNNENQHNEENTLKFIEKLGVSAVVISHVSENINTKFIKLLKNNNIPIIQFDRTLEKNDSLKIITDNFSTGYKAVEHLFINNYKRVAFLSGPPEINKYNEMVNGYKAGLKNFNLAFNPHYLIYSDLIANDMEVAVNRLLKLKQVPDSIFVAGAKAGAYVHKLLQDFSIKIPDEMGLICYGKDFSHKLLHPSLTTIEDETESVARLAFSQIDRLIKSKKVNKSGTLIKPAKLIIRNSTLTI